MEQTRSEKLLAFQCYERLAKDTYKRMKGKSLGVLVKYGDRIKPKSFIDDLCFMFDPIWTIKYIVVEDL